MDRFRIWAHLTGADIIVVLRLGFPNLLDKDAAADGFNIYCSDGPRKGGAVALCVCVCV